MSGVIARWTDSQCMQLKPVWLLSQARRESHYMAFKFFSMLTNITGLPNILIGAVLSTISMDTENVPAPVKTALAVAMTLISTVSTYFKWAQKAESHKDTYRAFNMLVLEIETSLLRGQEQPKRVFIDFYEYINDKYSNLVENAENLNSSARAVLNKQRSEKPSPFDNLRGIKDDILGVGDGVDINEDEMSHSVPSGEVEGEGGDGGGGVNDVSGSNGGSV